MGWYPVCDNYFSIRKIWHHRISCDSIGSDRKDSIEDGYYDKNTQNDAKKAPHGLWVKFRIKMCIFYIQSTIRDDFLETSNFWIRKQLTKEVKMPQRICNPSLNLSKRHKLCLTIIAYTTAITKAFSRIKRLGSVVSHEEKSPFWYNKCLTFIIATNTRIRKTSVSVILTEVLWFIELYKMWWGLSFCEKYKTILYFHDITRCTYDSFDEIAFFGSYSRCKYDDISSDRIWKSIAHLIHDDKFSITIFLACLSVCNSASMKCRLHRRANNLKWSENKRTYEKHNHQYKSQIYPYIDSVVFDTRKLTKWTSVCPEKIDKNCTKCNCQKQYKTNRDTQSVDTKESYYDDDNQYIEKYLINRWKTTLIFVLLSIWQKTQSQKRGEEKCKHRVTNILIESTETLKCNSEKWPNKNTQS